MTRPQRGGAAGPRSRGKSRGTASELAHQVHTTAEARERRRAYGQLKQEHDHLAAEARKARERADALRRAEAEAGKAEAAATHRVPGPAALGAVLGAAQAAAATTGAAMQRATA